MTRDLKSLEQQKIAFSRCHVNYVYSGCHVNYAFARICHINYVFARYLLLSWKCNLLIGHFWASVQDGENWRLKNRLSKL